MSSTPVSFEQALEHARGLSRFLVRMLASRPWLKAQLEKGIESPLDAVAMQTFIASHGQAENMLRPALRHLRTWVICHLIVRDLAGWARLSEVTETMTILAEVAIRYAHDVLWDELTERYGLPLSASGWEQELLVIGMGKLGGRELNVSSDIDLIFVYPEEGNTGGHKMISNFEFFDRLGKKLIQALADITEHGQVFRVDMRLRPNGESGPLVCSFGMLEHYFIAQGREWERYAWIKARVLMGQRWQELERIARPFVFRKYLDYGAIEAMRDLHAQIRAEVTRHDRVNNLKLGPGGIREVEFIAQVFQLIRGGRDATLQIRPTLQVLAKLGERQILNQDVVDMLSEAYVFLRNLEHRLQYLDDHQTHELPEDEISQTMIAQTIGSASYSALLARLDKYRVAVSRHFDAVFSVPGEARHPLAVIWDNAENPESMTKALSGLGYSDPAHMAQRLNGMYTGTRYRQLPGHIRDRFDALVPRMLKAAAAARNPDETLAGCLDLLETISRRGAYLALLQEYPQALQRVADLMSASRQAAYYLTRHPILLDELLDSRNSEMMPDWQAFRRMLAEQLESLEPDMERQMDVMREQHHIQTFRLLIQDLAGVLTVESLADHLSALADIILDQTIPLCWNRIKIRHRETPAFAVISYGKLGGKELGYASDLDIIFLYDDPAYESAEVYNRLGQRVNSWISSQTAAGILFETDLRLRPNGDSGLIACSLESFRTYQLESAWIWEHQALTRARFSAGDPALGAAFERIRTEVLCLPRDLDNLRIEVAAMRQKMRDAHAGRAGALFDLKHDEGGLIDVEFLVQYLVLGYAHAHPVLTGNLGNIALLRIAGELGLIAPAVAEACGDSYRQMRKLQHRQRLNAHPSHVSHEEVVEIRKPVQSLWKQVLG